MAEVLLSLLTFVLIVTLYPEGREAAFERLRALLSPCYSPLALTRSSVPTRACAMPPGNVLNRRQLIWHLCASIVLLTRATSTSAAPVLRSADIRIAIRSTNACDVTMMLALSGGGAVDHRIQAGDDTRIDVSVIRGARQVQGLRTVGRTRSLVLEPASGEYELMYSVQRSAANNRCPLWVPAAPADGVSRAVRISVELPSGMSSPGTMPALAWSGSTGMTTLGHIPAFVHVPYRAVGESMIWDVSTAMDLLTVVIFFGASGIWIWRRRR